ncbi:START domain-containing protein [Aureispira anguillae]|uniref:START domain-containing protein n=1 Tax=Aureispira anguillae TaxID=2864201 RepID=A0A916DSR4_9BACT|nr:START domain-containing protein [Aureispira anguillae]BDS12699.1 START domain-containing protein [Aureispira anguillae]
MRTTHYPIYSLLIVLGLFSSFSTLSAQSWKVAKDKNGVKVETRFIEGWSIKQYRATVYIKTTLAKAVEAYRDPVQRKAFMARSIEVSNLKEISKNEIITYNLGNAPWPVADRDNITHSIFKYSNNQVKVTMVSIPDFIPEKSGIVRVPRSEGFWLFIDQGNGIIKVVQQSVADLGGAVPDWLVNSTIVEGPYDVLLALKNMLQK